MDILFTICARAGSKGVKSKNMREFMGYPILYTTLSAYRLYLQRHLAKGDGATLAINTDAPELLEQAKGTSVPFLHIPREQSLAGDRAPKISVIADSYLKARELTGRDFQLVVDMDLTSPLRKPGDIAGVIDALLADPGADVAMSVTEARRNPYFNQLSIREDGGMQASIPSNFVARQQAPRVVDANASLYAYRPRYLLDNDGVLLHGRVVPYMMEDTAVLDIDSERDFLLLSAIAGWFYQNDPGFGEVHRAIPQLLAR